MPRRIDDGSDVTPERLTEPPQGLERCYIGLGSNLGDRQAQLKQALQFLHAPPHHSLLRVSSLYETPPFGPVPQPDFLNAVAEIETALSPLDLLAALKDYEVRAGRQDGVRWGPRVIDLDILLYDKILSRDRRLCLPHPGIPVRAFVLVPLLELAPELRVPEWTEQGACGEGRTVEALWKACEGKEAVRWVGRVEGPGLIPKAPSG